MKLEWNGNIKNVFDDATVPFIGCEFDLRIDYAFPKTFDSRGFLCLDHMCNRSKEATSFQSIVFSNF